MNKAYSFLLVSLLLAGCLYGCTAKTPAASAAVGTAADDILTCRRLDPGKTALTVSRTGNIYIERFSAEFEKRNPDVQVVCIDITGGGTDAKPAVDWIENGLAPDVMFWSSSLMDDTTIREYFTNLSTSPYTASYQAEALSDVASSDGSIYCLPCPYEVQCMIYNKTLFDKYGWEVPATFDEFVTLCERITKDTDGAVEPWNPNAKYSNELYTVLEGFLYGELFAGTTNRAWYDDAVKGKTEVAAHLTPMYDAVQTLIDRGILKTEHFSYSATERGKKFQAGGIAMINYKATTYSSDEFEFALMPFPGTTGTLGYVCKTYSYLVGIPKKEQSEKVADAIDRYMAFFSSEEGQKIFIGDSLEISSVKNVPLEDSSILEPLLAAINEGHQFSLMSFSDADGRINFNITADAKAIAAGEKTKEECLAAMRETPYQKYSERIVAEPEVIASAGDDLTVLETSFYIADMYRETAGADIGLIADHVAYRGNLMRIFKGDITPAHVTALLPRSFENGSSLIKAQMTGQQLLDALNYPVDNNGKTADSIYAYSGLKCTVAPWNAQGERFVSATLADGTAIDPEKLYTVAFWAGTVSDEYITAITDTCDGKWEELMTAKMKRDGTILPADDGRITLIWN